MDFIQVKERKAVTSGIITVVNWTMAPNGIRYLYFFCDRWEIITDKDIPVEKFKSAEKWQLLALDKNNDVVAIFPGCQIKAWVFCNKKPEVSDSGCYAF